MLLAICDCSFAEPAPKLCDLGLRGDPRLAWLLLSALPELTLQLVSIHPRRLFESALKFRDLGIGTSPRLAKLSLELVDPEFACGGGWVKKIQRVRGTDYLFFFKSGRAVVERKLTRRLASYKRV